MGINIVICHSRNKSLIKEIGEKAERMAEKP
jgi:hypothetical protein